MVLEKIKKQIAYFDFYGRNNDYEIKGLKVEKLDGLETVFVNIVTGHKNDEGTLAAILCRKYRRFFIGVKGGIRTYVSRNKQQLRNAQAVSVFELLNYRYTD